MRTAPYHGKGKNVTLLASFQRDSVNKYTKTDDLVEDRDEFQQMSMHPDPETYSGRGNKHPYDNISRTNTKEVSKTSYFQKTRKLFLVQQTTSYPSRPEKTTAESWRYQEDGSSDWSDTKYALKTKCSEETDNHR